MSAAASPTWRLDAETPGDIGAIRDLNRLAFERADEAELVGRLRADGDVVASIVARERRAVTGQILFSALAIEGAPRAVRAAALAPMAVHPARQRAGIGTALVLRGLEDCRDLGIDAVIVLGHESYYPRFGFSPATVARLRAPFSGPAFMGLQLTAGALEGVEGELLYPPAFRLG